MLGKNGDLQKNDKCSNIHFNEIRETHTRAKASGCEFFCFDNPIVFRVLLYGITGFLASSILT